MRVIPPQEEKSGNEAHRATGVVEQATSFSFS